MVGSYSGWEELSASTGALVSLERQLQSTEEIVGFQLPLKYLTNLALRSCLQGCFLTDGRRDLGDNEPSVEQGHPHQGQNAFA